MCFLNVLSANRLPVLLPNATHATCNKQWQILKGRGRKKGKASRKKYILKWRRGLSEALINGFFSRTRHKRAGPRAVSYSLHSPALSLPLGSLYYQRLTGQSIGWEGVRGGRGRFVVQSSIINNFVGQVSAIRSALSTCSFFSLSKEIAKTLPLVLCKWCVNTTCRQCRVPCS